MANALPEQLRRLRQHAGLTQEELAKRAGISRVYLSLLERGKRGGALQLVQKLVEACGGIVSIRRPNDVGAELLAARVHALEAADRERLVRLAVLLPYLPQWVREALDGDLRLWERQFLTGPQRDADPPAAKSRDQV